MHDRRTGQRALWWLLAAAVVVAPCLAWAQVQYRTLTLAESAYLYSGLAAQAVLRLSSLRWLPQVIVVSGVAWLVYRRVISNRPQPVAGIVSYVVSCTMILMLFWPEAAPRFFGGADDPADPRPGDVVRGGRERHDDVGLGARVGPGAAGPDDGRRHGGSPVSGPAAAGGDRDAADARAGDRPEHGNLSGADAAVRAHSGADRADDPRRAVAPDERHAGLRGPLLQAGGPEPGVAGRACCSTRTPTRGAR